MSPNRPNAPWLPPGTRGIDQVMRDSDALTLLTQRLRASQARLDALKPLLPPALRNQVQAGPLDESGWTLLASSQAAAAKLRYMVPAFEAHLRVQGYDGPPVRLKLMPPRPR